MTNQCRCAGKIIHQEFVEADSEQNVAYIDRYEKECILLSKLRHPNIVLFMGVYFKRGSSIPSLLMELLPTSLDGALTKYPNIPVYIKNVILYDIACGLNFLHSQKPPVIHRDLSSNNVLLSENLRAKIADLGVAKIASDKVVIPQSKLTKVPGTPIFMPPEAFLDDPVYDQSLDMFSYGNLILNTINQKWPRPGAREAKDKVIVEEVARRRIDFDEMGELHSLRKFTERCLEEGGANRPSATEAVQKLLGEIQATPPPFTDALQMMQHMSKLSDEAMQLKKTVNALQQERVDLDEDNVAVKNEKVTLEMELASLKEEISTTRIVLVNKEAEVSRLSSENHMKENRLRLKDDHIEAIKVENTALKTGNKVRR